MEKIRLIEPVERYFDSYREAIEEYQLARINDYAFSNLSKADLLAKFKNSKMGIYLKPGRVASTYYWLVSGETFIGEIAIRHELNDALLKYGGHIGYGIRYSCWNQGFGTQMLRLSLTKAQEMGLKCVLITCDDDNLASARVIEKNGGILQDKIQNRIDNTMVLTRRYWIHL